MIYDPYSRPFQEDPYPLYRNLRDESPCAYNPDMDFYALFRFEDVWKATLDWETMSSSLGPVLENRGQLPPGIFSIIGMDPPEHTRMRNLVSRGFTPRRIAALEEEIRGIAKGYLEPLSAESRFDFEQDFAVKFPMDVISALLGIPPEDRDVYRKAIDAGLHRDPDGDFDAERLPPFSTNDYVSQLIEARRREPREDLITVLATLEFEDMEGRTRRLNDQECSSFVTLLAAAGAETTAKLLGHAIYLLWKHPDQRDACFGDTALLPAAIEETLRYEAPSQFQGRVALRDTTWHGVTIPEGARVALVTGAASRDEREYPDADRFDIRRRPERTIFFGHGHHVCIGKSLARLETRIALEEVAARLPRYEVDESGITRTYQAHVRGYHHLPIEPRA